jgi:hypothetical protein
MKSENLLKRYRLPAKNTSVLKSHQEALFFDRPYTIYTFPETIQSCCLGSLISESW